MGSSSITTWLPYREAVEILEGLVHEYYGGRSGKTESRTASSRSSSRYVGWTDNPGLPLIGHKCYDWFWIPWGGTGKRSYEIDSESCGCENRTRLEILRRYKDKEAWR